MLLNQFLLLSAFLFCTGIYGVLVRKHAVLVPLIPAVSFVVILLFGRRMPRQGSEVGIAAIGASFLLSCGAAVGWIRHLRNAEPGTSALGALGRSVGRLTAEGHPAPVQPVL